MTRQPSFISSHAAHPRRVVIAASLRSAPPTVRIDTEFTDLGELQGRLESLSSDKLFCQPMSTL